MAAIDERSGAIIHDDIVDQLVIQKQLKDRKTGITNQFTLLVVHTPRYRNSFLKNSNSKQYAKTIPTNPHILGSQRVENSPCANLNWFSTKKANSGLPSFKAWRV